MTEAHESENSYLFEAENATEIARLLQRNTFFRKALGGALPEQANIGTLKSILDIGCGPGGWSVDIAKSYPDREVIGIDINDTMLNRAEREAKEHAAQNVKFIKMNALRPLEFPEQRFDLVNIRSGVEFIPSAYWPLLLQECYRITRPGGIVRLMEADRMAHTNSLAFETYHSFYATLLYKRGYGFSPDGQTFGITPMLGKLLHNAGYQDIRTQAYALDFSHATLFEIDYRHIVEIRFEQVGSQLLASGQIKPEDFASISMALRTEIALETFCGISYPFIFWAKKTA